MNVAADLIEVSDLSKKFFRGDEVILALNRVSFKITPGEFVCITGSSGSGKSTLMYILGLIDKQSSGTYKLQKAITDNLTDPQRSELRNRFFGFIFQGFHLLPRANAIRNVAMPLEYGASYGFQLTSKEIRDRAKIALERVGLESRMEHLPSELSGGQRQRVAIARALINNPSVIFADEPTGNLDSTTAQEIMDLFHRLNSEGTTIVLVTHDPHLAKQAKKQIVMSDGRIVGQ